MKKKEYIKPELNVYQMETQAILAGSYLEKAKEDDIAKSRLMNIAILGAIFGQTKKQPLPRAAPARLSPPRGRGE